jgi:hypothetical protein
VPYANAPYKSLTVEKAVQNWVQYEGAVFRFPGGGTQFPHGADKYIDQLANVVPFADGTVRTVLDTGCGVSTFVPLSRCHYTLVTSILLTYVHVRWRAWARIWIPVA